MKIKFLKNSKWKIYNEIMSFKKGEYAEIPDKTAQEMITKKYGFLYEEIKEKKEQVFKNEINAGDKKKEEAKRKKKETQKNKNKQKKESIHIAKNKHEIEKE